MLAAGQIKLNGLGCIRRIDNLSGHYRPTVDAAMRYQELFEEQGLELNNTWLEYYRIVFDEQGNVIDTIKEYNVMINGN